MLYHLSYAAVVRLRGDYSNPTGTCQPGFRPGPFSSCLDPVKGGK